MSTGAISYASAASSLKDHKTNGSAPSLSDAVSGTSISGIPVASEPISSDDSTVSSPPVASNPIQHKSADIFSSSKNSLTPAPAPVVNAWKIPQNSATLDTSNWPKPEESIKKDSSTSASKIKPVVRTSNGKEKWVPFTPIVESSVPSSQRPKKRSGTAGSGHHTNSQNHSNGQNGNGNGHYKQQYKTGDKKANGTSAKQHTKQSPQLTGKQQPLKKKDPIKGDKSSESNSTVSPTGSQSRSPPAKNKRSENGQHTNNTNGYSRPPYQANGNQFPFNRRYQKNYFVQPEFLYNQQQQFFAAAAAAAAASASPLPPPSQYDIAVGLVIAQLDYYLSVDNLVKDIYLRRQMNSKGFVPLHILGNFNRIRTLTGGDNKILTEACRCSPNVELVADKVRPRRQWGNWVLDAAERSDAGRDEDNPTEQQIEEETVFNVQNMVTAASFEPSTPKFDAASAVPFVPKNES